MPWRDAVRSLASTDSVTSRGQRSRRWRTHGIALTVLHAYGPSSGNCSASPPRRRCPSILPVGSGSQLDFSVRGTTPGAPSRPPRKASPRTGRLACRQASACSGSLPRQRGASARSASRKPSSRRTRHARTTSPDAKPCCGPTRADRLSGKGQIEEAEELAGEGARNLHGSRRRPLDARSPMGQIADILEAARRARRGPAHPPRGGTAGLRTPRRRALAGGHHGQDRRHRCRQRGELDEALRIRREEELPVYERLGDMRECGHHLGQDRRHPPGAGEIDEALRIRREEELPVYERLGDVRSTRHHHGPDRRHPPAARRVRRGPAHPPRGAAAGLRTPRRRALDAPSPWARSPTSCQAARRARRGPAHPPRGAAAGLRTPRRRPLDAPSPWARSPTSLPGARRATTRPCASAARKSCRSTNASATSARRAVTMGKIADILRQRGELRRGPAHPPRGGAAGLRTPRRHPLDAPSPWARSPTSFQRAASYDEALRIRREEELPVYEQLGDVREIARSLFSIAQTRMAKGIESAEDAQTLLVELTKASRFCSRSGPGWCPSSADARLDPGADRARPMRPVSPSPQRVTLS